MSGDDTRRSASGSLIRAFSGGARKALSSLSPNQVNQRTNNPRLDEVQSVSSLDPNDDNLMMSTRHNLDDDSHFLPKLRSTAQRYGRYNPPEPQPRITTSAVRGHFKDFDQDVQSDDERSLEIGRGNKGSARNTPSKINSDLALNIGNSSLWEITATPPMERRSKQTTKKGDGVERGSLKRDAQKRAASTIYKENGISLASLGRTGTRLSPGKKSSQEQRLSGFDKYDQAEDNDDTYYYGGRPNVNADPPSTVKPARFTSQRASVASTTPQRRTTFGTPRSAPNATIDSFALPEIPGLTELISGIRQDGTPIFSRTGKSRSKYGSRRVSAPLPNFIPIESVPMPEEEKIIIAQLQLLKDKLAEMEREKENADAKIEDYEGEILRLRDDLEAQDRLRRADSGLGPSDGEDGSNDKADWKIEKISKNGLPIYHDGTLTLRLELETSVKSLQTRLERSEEKASKAEHTIKRLTKERDGAAEQLAAAYLTQKELESENETLRNDNQLLHAQVQELKNENRRHLREREQLIAELDLSHNRHENETQQREAEFIVNANKTERALETENRNLRERLDELQTQYDEETKQLTQRESKALRAAQKAQAERQKLQEEKEHLLGELAQAKAEREAEMKRWNHENRKLEARLRNHEDTIHELQDAVPHQTANDGLREEVASLREQIAALRVDRDYDTANGTTRERELQHQLQQTQADHEQASLEWLQKEELLRVELEQEREKSRHSRKATSKVATQPEKDRGRSRSKSTIHRRKPSISISRTSDPMTFPGVEVEETVSESESTTDLWPFLTRSPKSLSKSKLAPASVLAADDITYLSPIHTQDVREIRRKIEEERLRHRVVSAQEPLQRDISEPMMSGAQPTKFSMKDFTGHSITSARRASTASVDYDESHGVSNDIHRVRSTSKSSRHRRGSSAYTEMTSAFILPDITLSRRKSQSQGVRPTLSDAAKEVISTLAPSHDIKNCTICARITADTDATSTQAIRVPELVPISSRADVQDNPDATLRPTQPAVSALAKVLKGLYDEHTHLVMRLHTEERKLAELDPAAGKHARAAVHDAIDGINAAIKLKADQIYALYDVVEAHKDELHVDDAAELDRTLDEVRKAAGATAARAAKKVVVESFHDSEDRVYGHGAED